MKYQDWRSEVEGVTKKVSCLSMPVSSLRKGMLKREGVQRPIGKKGRRVKSKTNVWS